MSDITRCDNCQRDMGGPGLKVENAQGDTFEFCDMTCLHEWAEGQRQAAWEAQRALDESAGEGSKQPVPKRRAMFQNPASDEGGAP